MFADNDLGSLPPLGRTDDSGPLPASPGGLVRRAAAVAIDILLAVAVVLGPLLALDRILELFTVPDDRAAAAWLTAAVLWLLAFVLVYSPVCVSRWGCTLGKRVMGVEVVRARDGARLGYGPAVLRHLINLLVTSVPVLVVGNMAAINLSEKRQGMHDKAVGSVVIHRR